MEICQTFRLRAIFPRSISQNNKAINLYKFSIVIFSRTIYKTYRRDRLKRYKIFHSRNSTRNSIIVTRDPTRLLKNRKKKKKKESRAWDDDTGNVSLPFSLPFSIVPMNLQILRRLSSLDGTGSRLHFLSNIASFYVIVVLGHIDKHVSVEIEGYGRGERKGEVVAQRGENEGWKKIDR